MKESMAFNLAQVAVLEHNGFNNKEKLEILRVLLEREDLALYSEKKKEKEKENAETL